MSRDNSKDDQKAIYRIHLDKAALDKVRLSRWTIQQFSLASVYHHGQNMAQYQSCIAPMALGNSSNWCICSCCVPRHHWSPQGVRDCVPRRYFWCRCHGAVRLGQGVLDTLMPFFKPLFSFITYLHDTHFFGMIHNIVYSIYVWMMNDTVYIGAISPWYYTFFLEWGRLRNPGTSKFLSEVMRSLQF